MHWISDSVISKFPNSNSVNGKNKLWAIVIGFFLFAFNSISEAQVRVGFAAPQFTSETRNLRIPQYFFPADTVKVEKKHSPKTAAIMSACLPGLGQIYNKKYWKLAIIYPAMGGLVFGISWNHHYYKYYRDALRARYDDDPATVDPLSLYSDDRIVTMKNYYQRYRDMCVIGFAATYLLQVIDASVDAHLFYFDVGPDLSLQWSPEFNPVAVNPTCGVGFQLRFH